MSYKTVEVIFYANVFSFFHSQKWSRRQESNPRQPNYKSGALPTELRRLKWKGAVRYTVRT
jgi:hypothetical protein